MEEGLVSPIAAAVGLGIVGFCAFPTAKRFVSRQRPRSEGYEVLPGLYESIDGKATDESEARYSDREARVAAWIGVVVGLGASLASAILLTVKTSQPSSWHVFNNWADVPAWVSLASP